MNMTFDTSGSVGEMPGWKTPVPTCNRFIRWSDLDPFTQGYVEALLYCLHNSDDEDLGGRYTVGFSDLSPEALGLILQDCELAQERCWWGFSGDVAFSLGKAFWEHRAASFPGPGALNDALRERFPPLLISVSSNGTVCVRVGA